MGQIPLARKPFTVVDTLTHKFQASQNISEKDVATDARF